MTETASVTDMIYYIVVLLILIAAMYGIAFLIKHYLPGVSDMMPHQIRKNKRLKIIEFLPVDTKNKIVIIEDQKTGKEYVLSSTSQGLNTLTVNNLDGQSEKKNNRGK